MIPDANLGWLFNEAEWPDRFAEMRDIVGHIQLGDAPDRTEPGTGVIDFDGLFMAMRALEWRGYVGGEYRTTAGTDASLGWRGRLLSGA